MAHLLSLPFRVNPSGKASAVEQGSDDYYKQQLAALVLTVEGERPINDEFGMPDMAFSGFPLSTLHSKAEIYLPEVSSIEVATEPIDDRSQYLTVGFEVGDAR